MGANLVKISRRLVIIIVVVLLCTVVATGLLISAKDQATTINTSPQPEATVSQTDNTNEVASGKYIDYSKSTIAQTSGTKILFFHAPWCPQCRDLEASIEASSIPEGVTIIKVDYDTNQGLRQKYGVTIQTTLVRVDDQGNLIKKYVAYEQPNFASVKENLLN